MIPDLVTLQEAKDHCRVADDSEDSLFALYISAASEAVLAHADGLDRTTGPETYPASVKTAALLLIAHWFDNREAVNIGNITTEIPLGTVWLASRYRDWSV
ncbi:head-tail connector protein [uncultured Brevundimonas sp.]|uniref:head-tail connector protein n=1 Tax=uncultured Brevundimonas sp. TaxID=213418 RepID=UPI002615FFD8|nr:head-tail connector protein [uncultured Brevundimonas sp.]